MNGKLQRFLVCWMVLLLQNMMFVVSGQALEPVDVSDDELAVDAIKGVPPGGHFFGEAHTLARYQTAFYQPLVSDWSNYENWQEAGSLTATQRANIVWKQMLEAYEQPAMDQAVSEALEAHMAKCKEGLKDMQL